MSSSRREILEQVASGDLSPEEADQLLRSLSEEPAPAGEEPGSPQQIRTVKVTAGFGALVIAGDPNVVSAEIDGRHTASVEGDVLVIRGDPTTDEDDDGP